jgi:hypothetical protein
MIKGFFKLQTPGDLLNKLRHDLSQMKLHPFDEYMAFNFFVTAEAMLDWIYPGNENKMNRKIIRNSEPMLMVTSDLASGAKHFSGLYTHHDSVKSIDISPGAFPLGSFPVGSIGNGVLRVHLNELLPNYDRKMITAFKLASMVLEYWEGNLSSLTDSGITNTTL